MNLQSTQKIEQVTGRASMAFVAFEPHSNEWH